MRELNANEICLVDGAGTLREPIENPQSELGKAVNDVARGLNDFGSWLGGAIYDLVNR